MITCAKCGNTMAPFEKPVTCIYRSPVDPAQDTFKCGKCGHQWKRYD